MSGFSASRSWRLSGGPNRSCTIAFIGTAWAPNGFGGGNWILFQNAHFDSFAITNRGCTTYTATWNGPGLKWSEVRLGSGVNAAEPPGCEADQDGRIAAHHAESGPGRQGVGHTGVAGHQLAADGGRQVLHEVVRQRCGQQERQRRDDEEQ